MKITLAFLIFFLGIIFGSFYACIGYRIPNKISTIKPGSFCPNCKKPLKWYMNIPLFSYIFLKGKCHYCKTKISILYPIIELLTGILFLVSYLIFDFTGAFFISIIISSVLMVTIVTDFKYYYVSDRVVILATMAVVLLYGYSDVGIHRILSAVAMFLLMMVIKKIGDWAFKKESIGGGDIKLITFIGLVLGFIPCLIAIIIASTLGLIYALFIYKKEEIIPFGPFLLASTLILWFFNVGHLISMS